MERVNIFDTNKLAVLLRLAVAKEPLEYRKLVGGNQLAEALDLYDLGLAEKVLREDQENHPGETASFYSLTKDGFSFVERLVEFSNSLQRAQR